MSLLTSPPSQDFRVVRYLLAELAHGCTEPEQVAGRLLRLRCSATRDTCPVGVYLRRHGLDRPGVSRMSVGITYLQPRVPIPAIITAFIVRFDKRKYPMLNWVHAFTPLAGT